MTDEATKDTECENNDDLLFLAMKLYYRPDAAFVCKFVYSCHVPLSGGTFEIPVLGRVLSWWSDCRDNVSVSRATTKNINCPYALTVRGRRDKFIALCYESAVPLSPMFDDHYELYVPTEMFSHPGMTVELDFRTSTVSNSLLSTTKGRLTTNERFLTRRVGCDGHVNLIFVSPVLEDCGLRVSDYFAFQAKARTIGRKAYAKHTVLVDLSLNTDAVDLLPVVESVVRALPVWGLVNVIGMLGDDLFPDYMFSVPLDMRIDGSRDIVLGYAPAFINDCLRQSRRCIMDYETLNRYTDPTDSDNFVIVISMMDSRQRPSSEHIQNRCGHVLVTTDSEHTIGTCSCRVCALHQFVLVSGAINALEDKKIAHHVNVWTTRKHLYFFKQERACKMYDGCNTVGTTLDQIGAFTTPTDFTIRTFEEVYADCGPHENINS